VRNCSYVKGRSKSAKSQNGVDTRTELEGNREKIKPSLIRVDLRLSHVRDKNLVMILATGFYTYYRTIGFFPP